MERTAGRTHGRWQTRAQARPARPRPPSFRQHQQTDTRRSRRVASIQWRHARRASAGRGGLLRRRQHDHAWRVDVPPGPRPLPARLLHPAGHRRLRLAAADVHPGGREHGPRRRDRGTRADIRGRPLRRRDAGDRRRGLRRTDGRPDLAGNARPGQTASGRRRAGLAGDGDSGGGGRRDRRPAGADRCARHGGRERGRDLHRPPGRSADARHGQGRRGGRTRRAGGVRPGGLLGVQRLGQRHPPAVAGRTPVRGQPGRPAAGARPGQRLAGAGLPDRP